jgi:hypothetical protein
MKIILLSSPAQIIKKPCHYVPCEKSCRYSSLYGTNIWIYSSFRECFMGKLQVHNHKQHLVLYVGNCTES